jgi:integrase/recombinase XerD
MKMRFNPQTGKFEVMNGEGKSADEINRFLETLSLRGLSPCTVKSYGYDLIVIHKWLKKEKRDLEELKGKDLFDFVRHERARGQAPRSINRRLITLRVHFHFLYERDVESGPDFSTGSGHYRGRGRDFMGLVVRRRRGRLRLKIKEEERLVVPLKIDEVNQFIKEITHYRDLAIVGLMLFCGLRSVEVRRLETSKVNLEERKITVMGKGGRERMVPLTDQVIHLIRSYVALERPKKSSSPKLFIVAKGKTRGRQLTESGFRSVFRYRRKVSGVKHANPHRFRHTFGTNMAKSKMNLRVLQELLGHAPGSPVTQRYLHIAMTDVAEAFFEACKEVEQKYHDLK